MRLPPPMPSAVPLLAYVAAVPTLTLAGYTISNHDASRIVELSALLAAALLYGVEACTGRQPPVAKPSAGFALIVALALGSAATSAVPGMAWREVALLVGLVGVARLAATRPSATLSWAPISALVGSSLYAFALAMLMLSPLLSREPADWTSLSVGYDTYRFFNHVQTVALPLLAIVACRPPAWRHARLAQGAAWFSMVIYWAFVFISGARGTALAIGAALLIGVVVLDRRTAWPIVRTLLIAAAAGAATYALLFVLIPAAGWLPVAQPAERSLASLGSDSSRLQLWRVAWEQISGSPWLGVGPMHYAHHPNLKAAHPHNIYLQIAAEWGIPMLLALLLAVWRGMAALFKTLRTVKDEATRIEGVGLFLACGATLADGFVSGNFVMPVCQMWIALCCAWALAWTRQHCTTTRDTPDATAWSWLAVAGLLASQLWLVVEVWPEASNLKAHLVQVRRDLLQIRTAPRFWSDGWF